MKPLTNYILHFNRKKTKFINVQIFLKQLTFKSILGRAAVKLGGLGGLLGKNISIDTKTNKAKPNST